MSRVPNFPPQSTDPIEQIVGPIVTLTATGSVGEQKAFLAEMDRQVAVIDARKRDKNKNYER